MSRAQVQSGNIRKLSEIFHVDVKSETKSQTFCKAWQHFITPPGLPSLTASLQFNLQGSRIAALAHPVYAVDIREA